MVFKGFMMKNKKFALVSKCVVGFFLAISFKGYAMEGSSSDQQTVITANDIETRGYALMEWLQDFTFEKKSDSCLRGSSIIGEYADELGKEFDQEIAIISQRIEYFNSLDYTTKITYQKISPLGDNCSYYRVSYSVKGKTYYFAHFHPHLRNQWRQMSYAIEKDLPPSHYLLNLHAHSLQEAELKEVFLNKMPSEVTTYWVKSSYKKTINENPIEELYNRIVVMSLKHPLDLFQFAFIAYQLELHDGQQSISKNIPDFIAHHIVTLYMTQRENKKIMDELPDKVRDVVNQFPLSCQRWKDLFTFCVSPNLVEKLSILKKGLPVSESKNNSDEQIAQWYFKAWKFNDIFNEFEKNTSYQQRLNAPSSAWSFFQKSRKSLKEAFVKGLAEKVKEALCVSNDENKEEVIFNWLEQNHFLPVKTLVQSCRKRLLKDESMKVVCHALPFDIIEWQKNGTNSYYLSIPVNYLKEFKKISSFFSATNPLDKDDSIYARKIVALPIQSSQQVPLLNELMIYMKDLRTNSNWNFFVECLSYQDLSKFFDLCLTAHYLDLHNESDSYERYNFNDVMHVVVAQKLIALNQNNPLDQQTVKNIANRMNNLGYDFKTALAIAFEKGSSSKFSDLWQNVQEDASQFHKGWQLFYQSSFAQHLALYPEICDEHSVNNEWSYQSPLIGKIASLWFGNTKINKGLNLIKQNEPDKPRSNNKETSFSGWFSGLKIGAIVES